jgi:hemerythrin-like domain-containing protein
MEHSLDICKALHGDHMATVRMLEDLEGELSKIGRNNAPNELSPELTKLLKGLVSIMQTEISSHFSFEEENLFPRIEQMGDIPMLSILRSEHNTIRPLAEKLTEAVETALAGGVTSGNWAPIYDMGMELAEREVFHIQKEEMGFLPLLEEILTPEDDQILTAAFIAAK